MSNKLQNIDDINAPSRKQDHIDLAFRSEVALDKLDRRFHYEPLLSAHPDNKKDISIDFLGQRAHVPLWVSSMTGGTEKANRINKNLARACNEFGFGMGLGSCRSLLRSDEYLPDFAVRPLIGDQLLYANLGIAQVEQLIESNELSLITELLNKLEANGLIIHINPMQEWLQPEGDIIKQNPMVTISKVLDLLDINIIVKEVGQGMGPASLEALLKLPIQAIEFAAHGGTNFAMLELLRSNEEQMEWYESLTNIGHSAEEMVDFTNDIANKLGDDCHCRSVIISGGIKTFLDGYYLSQKSQLKAVYGQASSFLKYAQGEYEQLQDYVQGQVDGLRLAHSFLQIRTT